MFPLRKDDLSSLKCLLLLMIDPTPPLLAEDSQPGQGTGDGGTKDGHSQIKTPDSSVAELSWPNSRVTKHRANYTHFR